MDLLAAGKFEEVSKAVPNRVIELLECEPITSLISNAGAKRVEEYVAAEIVKLAANVNINPALNVKGYQIQTIASHLIENYKWESIEDFTLCFRRASCGFYGDIYRIDAAVIGSWMAKYLDEKYDALEQKKKKENSNSDDWKPLVKKYTPGFGKSVMQKYLEDLGVKPEDTTNSTENKFQRQKLETPYVQNDQLVFDRKEKLKEFQRKALRDKYPDATDEQIDNLVSKLKQ